MRAAPARPSTSKKNYAVMTPRRPTKGRDANNSIRQTSELAPAVSASDVAYTVGPVPPLSNFVTEDTMRDLRSWVRLYVSSLISANRARSAPEAELERSDNGSHR